MQSWTPKTGMHWPDHRTDHNNGAPDFNARQKSVVTKYKVLFIHGYLGLFIHGHLGLFIHGYLGQFIHGYLGLKTPCSREEVYIDSGVVLERSTSMVVSSCRDLYWWWCSREEVYIVYTSPVHRNSVLWDLRLQVSVNRQNTISFSFNLNKHIF